MNYVMVNLLSRCTDINWNLLYRDSCEEHHETIRKVTL